MVPSEKRIALRYGYGVWREAIYMQIYIVFVWRILESSTDYAQTDGIRLQ
jgi:hypothetical protein